MTVAGNKQLRQLNRQTRQTVLLLSFQKVNATFYKLHLHHIVARSTPRPLRSLALQFCITILLCDLRSIEFLRMLAQLGCAEEDAEVDLELGYPPVYAKLCRHEDAAGLPIPFTEAPPQRFLPYAPHAEDFLHLKDWDSLFPVVAEKERDSSNLRKYAEELWQQLDHLGNAGFDPSKFRVDHYGNVVYWNADPSSPLAWDIDHWFPSSRGGTSELPNLRIVQWQALLRKRNRLEFLVPWWDLQHGCSINQFLSAFAAKNADFRKRSFALFFIGGEDEAVAKEHVGECRPWPQHFREQKALCGLAAAAIVNATPKDNMEAHPLTFLASDGLVRTQSSTNGNVLTLLNNETSSKRHWTVEEEEAVKKGVKKFGAGSWNEIKAGDPVLANRSTSQIKEKFRSMRGVSRNNGTSITSTSRSDMGGRQSAATTALQKELRVKIGREEERREREEELTQLEDTVMKLKLENEKDRAKALQLESLLKKRKHRVEKHRKLAESQASYRLCLERVLRDTMHQAMTYKEQALLTQEACNVLIARLDSEKTLCEAMESELLQRNSTKETLASLAAAGNTSTRKGVSPTRLKKAVTKGRDLVDVSSCVSLRTMEANNNNIEDDDDENVLSALSHDEEEVHILQREHQRKALVRHAIKEYMQQPRTRAKSSEETAKLQQYDADSETPESSSDSDFADDEMSPPLLISQDTTCNNSDDNQVVSELSKSHDESKSGLRDFCIRISKPGEKDCGTSDTPIPSAGETSRSDSKREVQKDVISESTTKFESKDSGANTFKQAYLDELLQHIRFQIPTPEAKGQSIQAHVDELLEQVLTTHLENMRRTGARKQSPNPDTDSDEPVTQTGSSNLDKWLQTLLVKGAVSAASSPGRDSTPLHSLSPAVSQSSMTAMRESQERASQQEHVARNAEKPRSLRGTLLRKLSVKHQAELESENFNALGRRSGEEETSCPALSGWPGGIPLVGMTSEYWLKDQVAR